MYLAPLKTTHSSSSHCSDTNNGNVGNVGSVGGGGTTGDNFGSERHIRRDNAPNRAVSNDEKLLLMRRHTNAMSSTSAADCKPPSSISSLKPSDGARRTAMRAGKKKDISSNDTSNPYQQMRPPGISCTSSAWNVFASETPLRQPRRFATTIPNEQQCNERARDIVYHHGGIIGNSYNQDAMRIPREIVTNSPPSTRSHLNSSVLTDGNSIDEMRSHWEEEDDLDEEEDLNDIYHTCDDDVGSMNNYCNQNNGSNTSMNFNDLRRSLTSTDTATSKTVLRQPNSPSPQRNIIQVHEEQPPPPPSIVAAICEENIGGIDQENDWKKQLHPFVSDIVFRSVIHKQHHLPNPSNGIISFRPYTCQAAILFVDLCGYSKITAAIAHRGAHFLSETVNAYLFRLLQIVADYGGDVIKFAGDAIMIVWYGVEQELEVNVLCAALCATELQTKAGEHQVGNVEDNLSFQIHIGLCCGSLDSEIFEAPINNNMQRLYHYVGGEAILEIGELVDLAKAGEICVSRNCFNFLENGGTYTNIEGPLGAKLLHSLDVDDPDLFCLVRWHISKSIDDRKKLRIMSIEEDFIHSNVLANLSHGGFSPTQIAQMRNLCVLFIAMTSNGCSMNWLMEVQAILDTKRCPIVQIILDDKGVHIVAAVNLYEAIPEASLVGLEVCRELINKRVGAAVGCAIGPTFCGVTGSSTACRWDITGPSVVRAARLMQYALSNNVHFAIDQSLYDDPLAATRMKVLNQHVAMKGTMGPIVVYTLSDAKLFSAFRILENVHGSVHNNQVQEIQNHIDNRERSAVIVTGIPLAGMIIACQRAAGYSDFVPYLHLCEISAGFLQLARTIAMWFQYVNDAEIKNLAKSVLTDMSSGCWSCAHDQCVVLVNDAINKGYHACFVVDRIHRLDKFSLSLIHECLRRPKHRGIIRRTTSSNTFCSKSSFESTTNVAGNGQICFLCTHLSSYNSKSAEDIVGGKSECMNDFLLNFIRANNIFLKLYGSSDILRSDQSFQIPIITLGESSKDDLRTLTREMIDFEVGERWLDAYVEASGYCAEYFLQRVETVRKITTVQWKVENENRRAYFEVSDDLLLHIPPGLVRKNKELKVTAICPELAMIFSNVYDDFPPICQMIIKVITIATRRGFYKLPYGILVLAMDDLFDCGIGKESLDLLIEEMIELCVIKIEDRDDRTVGLDSFQRSNCDSADEEKKEAQRVLSIQSPALEDITMDVCIPNQVRTIAKVLIKHLSGISRNTFQLSFTLASLHCLLKETTNVQRLWKDGYHDFLTASLDWPERRTNKWKEIIDDEIRDSGYDSQEILGPGFQVQVKCRGLISPGIALLKSYSAPIALGPMSQSLFILCRNTFYESGLFVGGSSTDVITIRNVMTSSSGRYMMQLSVVEDYLRDMGFGAPRDEIQSEMEMISFIANPADSFEGVATKAVLLLEEIVPRFIEHRLQRLYKLVRSLKDASSNGTKTDVFHSSSTALRLAYEALQTDENRMDAAQDALMILATMNWKPQFPVMEYIPIPQQHTVANIRDATLKRLSEVEGDMFRHRQNIDDLEAFLIISALLENATENGFC